VVLRSEPTFSDPFWIVEAACIAAFTAELSLRAWATNDKITTFFSRGMNVVDLVAILPFYVDLLAKGLTIPGLSVLRVLRLARVFRLLRVSKTAVDLLGQTMRRSARPLYILAFLLMMALITFSAVLYFAERGTYDDTKKLWMRTLGFECEFPCAAQTLDFLPAFLTCGDVADETNTVSAYFDRHKPTVPAIASTCERVVEQSPFQSILHAVWWALATMGTVGYGDIAPRTVAGWILASLAQMMGILVIALPITVIGSNFSAIYSSIGTSQSLWAKEHEPSSAAKPRRLHASGSGATAQKLTDGGMVGPLQHEWDLDVAFEELLPCASPALVGGAETNGASGGKIGGSPRFRGGRARSVSAGRWCGARSRRRSRSRRSSTARTCTRTRDRSPKRAPTGRPPELFRGKTRLPRRKKRLRRMKRKNERPAWACATWARRCARRKTTKIKASFRRTWMRHKYRFPTVPGSSPRRFRANRVARGAKRCAFWWRRFWRIACATRRCAISSRRRGSARRSKRETRCS
jgi:hypothetical protein